MARKSSRRRVYAGVSWQHGGVIGMSEVTRRSDQPAGAHRRLRTRCSADGEHGRDDRLLQSARLRCQGNRLPPARSISATTWSTSTVRRAGRIRPSTTRAPAAVPPCGDLCFVWEGSAISLKDLLRRSSGRGKPGTASEGMSVGATLVRAFKCVTRRQPARVNDLPVRRARPCGSFLSKMSSSREVADIDLAAPLDSGRARRRSMPAWTAMRCWCSAASR